MILGSPEERRAQRPAAPVGRRLPGHGRSRPPAASGVKFIIPMTPPGRQTRRSSLAVASWFGANIAPKHEVTTSNSASAKGSDFRIALDPVERDAASRAARRPASKCSGVRSDATTLAPACAARMATLPVPAATSRTRWPAVTPHASDEQRPELPHGRLRESVIVAQRPHRPNGVRTRHVAFSDLRTLADSRIGHGQTP